MSASFGKVNVSAPHAYSSSFGALPHETMYMKGGLDPESKQDYRPALANVFDVGRKAFLSDSDGSGSTDKVMVPIYLDPVIVDESRKWTPLVELIPRVTNLGLTADFNIITDKGDAFFAGEDAALSENDDTRVRRSKAIKFLYSVGRVSGVAQAAVPSFMLAGFQPSGIGAPDVTLQDVAAPNAKQLEVLSKTRAIKEKEEDTILNGDVGSNALEFDGLIVQIAGVNDLDLSGVDIALNDLNTSVQDAFDDSGRPNLGVCNSRTYRDILNLLNAQITYREAARQVFWGFSAVVFYSMVGEIPIIPSQFLTNDANLGRLMFLDLSVIEMRVLQDLTFVELAKTNDSDKFFLKEYLTLIVRAPKFNAQIINID